MDSVFVIACFLYLNVVILFLLCFKCHAQIEEQVDRQRAHAMSTLDRLARQVAVEKMERLEKCKAFKV